MPDVKPVGREWDYYPVPEGEPFVDKDGHCVLGWHDRSERQDEQALLAEFEAWYGDGPLELHPILARSASDVECRINGWEEGTFVECTSRAKKSWPMWKVVAVPAADREGEHGD